MKLLVVLLLCAALAFSSVAALPYVYCIVDCDATPDVGAAVSECIGDKATMCERCELAVRRDQWPPFNTGAENKNIPEKLSHCSVLHSNCSHVPDDIKEHYICIPYMQCQDSAVMVRVKLSGICDAATLRLPGVPYIAYFGPATLVGQVDIWHPSNVLFNHITFDGNGTTGSLMMDEILGSNITMAGCDITGFNGPYVFKAEAHDYFVVVALYNLYMHDIKGKALHFDGLSTFVLLDFMCERCTSTANSECIHFTITPVSDGKVTIANSQCA